MVKIISTFFCVKVCHDGGNALSKAQQDVLVKHYALGGNNIF